MQRNAPTWDGTGRNERSDMKAFQLKSGFKWVWIYAQTKIQVSVFGFPPPQNGPGRVTKPGGRPPGQRRRGGGGGGGSEEAGGGDTRHMVVVPCGSSGGRWVDTVLQDNTAREG